MTAGRHLTLLVGALGLSLACRGSSGKPVAARDDAGIVRTVTAPADAAASVAPLVLGVTDVATYGYRQRAGEPAFARARKAEAAGTWDEVVAACRDALRADPQHLDAAYLLAVALAKTGAPPADIAGPLATAVGGDFIKWGAASLAQPALQAFLATELGAAYQARVTEAQRQLAATLAHALLVSARGDIYAYDRDAARFHRVTRTGGLVTATVRHGSKLAYLTRRSGVGLVDLAELRSKKIVRLPAAGNPAKFGYDTKLAAFVVHASGWHAIVEHGVLLALRAARSVKIARTAPQIAADYDDDRLASALKIETTRRVVTVPSPGMIVGPTVTWSPDRSQLAFVAQRTEDCASGEPATAAFVADAATGTARELARAAAGIAIEWIAERTLAIAGDRGVTIHELAGDAAPLEIPGVDGLATSRWQPSCAAAAALPPPELPGAADDLGGEAVDDDLPAAR